VGRVRGCETQRTVAIPDEPGAYPRAVLERFVWDRPQEPCELGATEFQEYLDYLRRLAPHPGVGFFGPGSVAWAVNREWALNLGGLRALLMQVAHPKVAEGVLRHSRFTRDPFGRALNTVRAVQAIIFGTADEACEVARQVYLRHLRVRGPMPQDVPAAVRGSYDATDPALTLWVHATLIESAVFTLGLLFGPLSDQRSDALYQEGKLFALFFGITPRLLPGSWGEFRGWFDKQLSWPYWFATHASRRVAGALLGDIWWGRPLSPLLRFWAAYTLPDPMRQRLGLRLTSHHRKLGRCLADVVARILDRLPALCRYTPRYRSAMARIAARGSPSAEQPTVPVVRVS